MFNNSPEGGLELTESCCTPFYGFLHQKGQEDPLEKGVYPFQYSGLEKSMNCIVHAVTKSRTRLSDFHFQFSHQNDTDLIGPEKVYIAQTTREFPV